MINFLKLKDIIKQNISFVEFILLLSFFAVGGFNEFVSCLLSVAFSGYLLFKFKKNEKLCIKVNLTSIAVSVIVLFYGISVLWALDKGMAFIGFFKFFPLILFLLSFWQTNKTNQIFNILPYIGVFIASISTIFSFIPAVSGLFTVSGRLSGFFQYPNTFALFLLVCELLIICKSKLKLIDWISLIILIGCLLYTGSRTAFVLFLVSNFVMLLTNANKKFKIILFVSAILMLAVIFIIAMFGPEGNIFSRYLKYGLTESTLIGRLLYISDALPLVLKYPFGMGYMGYHFIQGSIQTGVYNVAYVHNEFLQFALDIGLIPALIFVVALVRFFFKKHISFSKKVIVAVICLHSLFDFNFQFLAILMLLLLLCEDEKDKCVFITKTFALRTVTIVFAVINLYMALSLTLAHFGVRETADKLFPYNTRNTLNMLNYEENIDRANELAEKVLKQNTNYYAPFSAKAKYAYSEGDFVGVIENKNAVFDRIPFRYTEYREYCVMLINGITAYEKIGDSNSALICKNELIRTKEKLESNEQRLSLFGSMIDEQPATQLSSDILYYIENLEKEQLNED